jgi:hypothetical protein
MNKTGQFYLIAAVIIILIIFGLITISNRSIVQPKSTRFYDLSEDYGAETARVIDYGVYNKYSPAVNISEKVKNISDTFARSAFAKDPNVRLVYVYGNKNELWIGNTSIVEGDISYCPVSGSCQTIPTAEIQPMNEATLTNVNNVTVSLAGNSYTFGLSEQENFYFVIQTTTPALERNVVVRQ